MILQFKDVRVFATLFTCILPYIIAELKKSQVLHHGSTVIILN